MIRLSGISVHSLVMEMLDNHDIFSDCICCFCLLDQESGYSGSRIQFLNIRTLLSFLFNCLKSCNFHFQDSLQSKSAACQEFVSQLNESLAFWGCRLPVDARYILSFPVPGKMFAVTAC